VFGLSNLETLQMKTGDWNAGIITDRPNDAISVWGCAYILKCHCYFAKCENWTFLHGIYFSYNTIQISVFTSTSIGRAVKGWFHRGQEVGLLAGWYTFFPRTKKYFNNILLNIFLNGKVVLRFWSHFLRKSSESVVIFAIGNF